MTALGGGGGGAYSPTGTVVNGLAGGSGGGGGAFTTAGTGGAGTASQGSSGGTSSSAGGSIGGGGGGGGASAAGLTGSPLRNGGNGGAGTQSFIRDASGEYFAGGGGGGGYLYANGLPYDQSNSTGLSGTGGIGGGGSGGALASFSASDPRGAPGIAATANTGGGGGGASDFAPGGGAGGSGIVIIRYVQPAPGFSASTPTFPATTVSLSSEPIPVTVTNTGSTDLTFAAGGITVSGDFAIASNSCSGSSVAAAGTCAVAVRFSPTASGTRTGTLTFASNAASSPNTVALSGTGTAPGFSASTPTFPATTVSSSSEPIPVTVTNTGSTDLTFAAGGITVSGDFAIGTDSCSGRSVASAWSCAVAVTFTPTASGTRTGTLTFASNAASSPNTVSLSGTGTPASGGGGGTGGSTAVPIPTTVPVPTAAHTVSLDVVTAQEGLRPGESVVIVGGQSVTVEVRANPASTGLVVAGTGWTVDVAGRLADGAPAPLGPANSLRLAPGGTLATSGSGFQSFTEVRIYLMSTPVLLDTLMTDATGTFADTVPVPADAVVGAHTAQVNGFTPGGSVRSVSLGVEVLASTTEHRIGTRVHFWYRSTDLTPTARRKLQSLVHQVPSDLLPQSIVVGVMRGPRAAATDQALAQTRARVVARYLRHIGLAGPITVTTKPFAVHDTAAARRVNVIISFAD